MTGGSSSEFQPSSRLSSAFAASISDGGHALFNAPFQWVCLANGDADFQDNVIFFGFDAGAADPVLVAKVPRLVKNGWMLKTEHDHLADLWDCMGNTAVDYVPRIYGFTSIQDRSVLMISYVPGESLTRLTRKSFWADPRQVTALARQAAGTLRAVNEMTARPVQQSVDISLTLQKNADRFRGLFELNKDEDHALSDLVRTVNEKSRTVSHDVLI